jgi:hypothetical protein
MQHRSLTQACTRVVAGMFIGVLMAAAPGAFADEAGSFNQNVSFSPDSSLAEIQSQSKSLPTAGNNDTSVTGSSGRARAFLSGMAGKAGDVVVGALNMIGASIAAALSAMCSRTRSASHCRAAPRR